jgi:hypothetical protein
LLALRVRVARDQPPVAVQLVELDVLLRESGKPVPVAALLELEDAPAVGIVHLLEMAQQDRDGPVGQQAHQQLRLWRARGKRSERNRGTQTARSALRAANGVSKDHGMARRSLYRRRPVVRARAGLVPGSEAQCRRHFGYTLTFRFHNHLPSVQP